MSQIIKISRLGSALRQLARLPHPIPARHLLPTLTCRLPTLVPQRGFHISRARFDDDPKHKSDDNPPAAEEASADEKAFHRQLVIPSMNVLAPIQIPDFLAKVPCVAIARNPLFPRFIKMIEVTDKSLIELIRRKVHMNVPFIGVFMRKDADREDDVVHSLDEVYKVGTFSQITELQDLGDKLRMIVMGHRRIAINASVADLEDVTPMPADDAPGKPFLLIAFG